MSAATYGVPGGFDPQQPGNPAGGASTGIGLSCLGSGPDANNFSVDQSNDVVLPYIGCSPDTAPYAASNLGNIVLEPTQGTGGSGYTPDGRYRIQSAGGGRSAGTAEVEIVVASGAITWARVVRAGSNFTSAPTFDVSTAKNFDTGATIAGGTLGTVTVTVGNLGTKPTSVGTAGNNKPFRRVLANAPAANGAAVPPSTYLNYSGRAMVAGEEVYAVAP